ncbi:MAG: bifunctional riboflavin kinase/FAD synthetase [bacterium]
MKVYSEIEDIDYNPDSIITVGTFDGVHLGHQKVLRQLIEKSKKYNLRAVVVTFDPHPQHVVQNPKYEPIKLLTDINERIRLFKQLGIENVLVIPFSMEFANLSPEEFVEQIFVKKIGVNKVLIGYDHLFGNQRSGDFTLLTELGEKFGFTTERLKVEVKDELIISSSKIRKAIASSMIEYANSLLGYHYTISGIVVQGYGLAAKLGFPTANIGNIHPQKQLPAYGVYLTSALIDGKRYYGMANCGIRPTLLTEKRPSLEVHFFDFEGNIYGKVIDLEVINFIRFERKFEDAEELKMQIYCDRQKCYELIGYRQ